LKAATATRHASLSGKIADGEIGIKCFPIHEDLKCAAALAAIPPGDLIFSFRAGGLSPTYRILGAREWKWYNT